MDKFILKDYVLKMIAGIEMNESVKDTVTNKYVKTGKKVQAYEYTFIKNDITKNRIVILANKDLNLKEGLSYGLQFAVGFDTFNKKNKFSFDSVVKA